ncbi:amidohydrolase [Vibrio europaeus]|uniref:Amidohydrolase n=1 Tax=Vibrio europaeus TaxID=300876 RepID=A0AAE7AVF2_9VIBR|nr:amidohydrolase [Vibrio europaeus]MDC5807182.1 amidohydrolase [Vibrio europaeus]MDC5809777.1 amidohydrolase [Vibrio europaeus]MDC5827707.1 amidohydrolase [Vibrio europaeus]MDC5830551.1 amidohydrolase [Vibrio europaeus]MDC5837407.1 amidohydrolase [Vibrio europaeus]
MSLKTSLSTIALLVSASVNAADEVYVNGQVYTVNENQPWAEAFAVEGGKFVQVGNTNEIKKMMNSSTKLIDLQGQFVMPGMIDDHIHPGFGAEMVMNVGTEYAMTYEQFGQKIGQFRKNNPDTKWVYGGPLNWLSDDNGLIEVFNQPSNKSILDKFVSDKPAFFWDVGGHAALVNSKALEMLNITKDTPDPKGGVYVRDANGDLTGVLRENAATIVWESFLVDRPSNKEFAYNGLKPVFDVMNSFGVTSISDVWAREWILRSYGILSKNDALNVRIFAYIADPIEWKSKWMQELATKAIQNYQSYNTDRVTVSGVKFVLDGSAGGQTAVMVDPFEGTDNRGYWRDDPDYFIEKIAEYDKKGLTVKVHAVGDGAIRKALEGIGNTRQNGSELRHSVAHTVFVNPADKKLFKQYEAVAEFSPYFWYPGPHTEMIKGDVGEKRLSWVFPFRSLVDKGVHVSVGSDWPVAASPNPWPAIESMMTRKQPGGEGSTLAHQEAISLKAALKAYTLGGAYAQYQEHNLGSIESGKLADFIVTNQNPFEVSPTEIHKTQVLSTVLGGEEVYRAQ